MFVQGWMRSKCVRFLLQILLPLQRLRFKLTRFKVKREISLHFPPFLRTFVFMGIALFYGIKNVSSYSEMCFIRKVDVITSLLVRRLGLVLCLCLRSTWGQDFTGNTGCGKQREKPVDLDFHFGPFSQYFVGSKGLRVLLLMSQINWFPWMKFLCFLRIALFSGPRF